ncbi:hypothetical protein DYL59_26530 [Pseudomonas kairouanensis]|uniref:Uncharacterized protein n=1 Tax=Pseudomonas kairouanensis TaxID=2293832 RepID=A0A4Z0AG26_9PSED|nr:hypothetical protein [Pseudomonas kairouanensis]TFY85149.1 hypothetical protein DYL59_26530 [Pseudomonas kairouanensis]
MANFLKQQNDIVTLKVELKPRGEVVCTLQHHQGPVLVDTPLWSGEQEAFGLLSSVPLYAPDELKLGFPVGLNDALNAQWQQHGAGYSCLWVHLVQPCGTLNFLPWESVLEEHQIPVLMLPDFIFPPPQKSVDQLDVVVCASVPLNSEKAFAEADLLDTLRAIVRGVDREVRLHVFADSDLAAHLHTGHLDCEVIVYTTDAYPASGLSDSSLRSPWLIWMRAALSGYSVDAVHFICHGHLSGRQGSLLFAQAPTGRSEDFLSGAVGAVELTNFLIQVGAWASSFSLPTDSDNALGLRVLADEIAQKLPGPMMMFDARRASCDVLEEGFRFIHSPRGQIPAYNHASLYLYCQPYLLTRAVAPPDRYQLKQDVEALTVRYARNAAQAKTVLDTYALETDAPAADSAPSAVSTSPAIAATERAAEQIQLHYQKLIRDEVIPEEIALQDLSIAMQTIQQFRQALGEAEQRGTHDDIGHTIADEGEQ